MSTIWEIAEAIRAEEELLRQRQLRERFGPGSNVVDIKLAKMRKAFKQSRNLRGANTPTAVPSRALIGTIRGVIRDFEGRNIEPYVPQLP